MNEKTIKIVYTEADAQGLELIGDLWQKLHAHHKQRNKHFPEYYDMITWDKRREELLEKASKGKIYIDLAWDVDSGKTVGYCVSTIVESGVGEIDSIFIEEPYRRSGIGGAFMKKALARMDSQSVMWKMLTVAGGNEEVFSFYQRFGFYPRFTMLAQEKKKE
jgi:ribosomal protein S18 acetylase RimI-like enzyme